MFTIIKLYEEDGKKVFYQLPYRCYTLEGTNKLIIYLKGVLPEWWKTGLVPCQIIKF